VPANLEINPFDVRAAMQLSRDRGIDPPGRRVYQQRRWPSGRQPRWKRIISIWLNAIPEPVAAEEDERSEANRDCRAESQQVRLGAAIRCRPD
jgi:hypothetical protein